MASESPHSEFNNIPYIHSDFRAVFAVYSGIGVITLASFFAISGLDLQALREKMDTMSSKKRLPTFAELALQTRIKAQYRSMRTVLGQSRRSSWTK